MANQNVRFYFANQKAKYDALVEKNPVALYFIEDVENNFYALYKGENLIATGSMATSMAAGLMSAEDKAKLDALAASGNMDLIPVDSSIIIEDTEDGKSIGVAISTKEDNLITVEDDGLFASVDSLPIDKIVGLEDKLDAIEDGIDSIPSTYATIDLIKNTIAPIKYEISNTPEGTLVNYWEKEIRIMCPSNAKFVKQNVGSGGNANMYYMTFTTYAPENAVTFKEGDRGVIVDEVLDFENTAGTGVDKYGRKFKNHWFALASYDEAKNTWTYFGENSSAEKYIGWDYVVEWYDANGIKFASDSIRINLSNENCSDSSVPYYMNNYATVDQITKIEESLTWNEIVEF